MAADRFYFYRHETLKQARSDKVPAESLIDNKTNTLLHASKSKELTLFPVKLSNCIQCDILLHDLTGCSWNCKLTLQMFQLCQCFTFKLLAFFMIEPTTLVMKEDSKTYQMSTQVFMTNSSMDSTKKDNKL